MTIPRWDEAKIIMETEENTPTQTPFEWIGGEARVKALVERFYDLMDLEPAYRELRAAHGSDLASARDKLFWFLCGWLGGPSYYTDQFGHPRLKMRHMPFSIGILERDQSRCRRPEGAPAAPRRRLRPAWPARRPAPRSSGSASLAPLI